jgi:hypothetical protein
MQRTSPVRIIGKVGKNAYRLDLPAHLKIHPVVSVTQLEPVPKGKDPYERSWEARDGPVDSAQDEAPSYVIDRLINRRVDKVTGRTQYLISWKGWGVVHNVWYDKEDLDDAPDMVRDYDLTHPETQLEREAKDAFRKRKRTQARQARGTRQSERIQRREAPGNGNPAQGQQSHTPTPEEGGFGCA